MIVMVDLNARVRDSTRNGMSVAYRVPGVREKWRVPG